MRINPINNSYSVSGFSAGQRIQNPQFKAGAPELEKAGNAAKKSIWSSVKNFFKELKEFKNSFSKDLPEDIPDTTDADIDLIGHRSRIYG